MARPIDELYARIMTPAQLKRARKRAREVREEYLLSELRKASGMTQVEVAKVLGMKQPSLSKLEKQTDMQLSTLSKIVKALGGELEIVAKFPKGLVTLGQFAPRKRPRVRT